MNIWLVVERLENWETDRVSGFSFLGFEDRYRKTLTTIKAGDRLVIYVASRISSFSDIREVADGVVLSAKRLPWSKYDTPYPHIIRTHSVLALPRDAWVPIHGLLPKLSFLQKGDWRLALRSSLRRLSDEDGFMIMAAMKDASK